jgi:nucleotide-binding universal stress UspA family protein
MYCNERGSQDETIVDEVKEITNRDAMHQLLMGSFSEEIIDKSRYPVLVNRTHKRT